jgi:hypothetical protein
MTQPDPLYALENSVIGYVALERENISAIGRLRSFGNR